jgi:ribonuclease HI
MSQKSRLGDLTTALASRHAFLVDASHSASSGITGIGIVHRMTSNPRAKYGDVVSRYAEAYVDVPRDRAEAFAVLRALEIATNLGAARVKVWSDYNQMRRYLKRAHDEGLGPEDDGLQSRILTLAASFGEVKFGFVPRRKNGDAHSLARLALQVPPSPAREDIDWRIPWCTAKALHKVSGRSPNPSAMDSPVKGYSVTSSSPYLILPSAGLGMSARREG